MGAFPRFSAIATIRDLIAAVFNGIGIARFIAVLNMDPAHSRYVVSLLPWVVDFALHKIFSG